MVTIVGLADGLSMMLYILVMAEGGGSEPEWFLVLVYIVNLQRRFFF